MAYDVYVPRSEDDQTFGGAFKLLIIDTETRYQFRILKTSEFKRWVRENNIGAHKPVLDGLMTVKCSFERQEDAVLFKLVWQ